MIGRWNSQRWGLWADNVTLNPGSGGAELSTDDLGGTPAVHVQRVKVQHGTDGSATDVSTASPLPVGGAAAHDAAAAGNPLPMGAEFDDTLPDAVDEGDIGRLRISANRNLYVTVRDAAGNERGLNVAADGSVAVTAASLPLPSGASTSAKQDTAQTALDAIKTATELIDDAAHARNGAFSKSLAIGGELDDTTPVAATEGNVSPVRITAQRAVHANLRKNDGTEMGTSADPVRTDPTGTTTQPVSAASLPLPTGASTEASLASAVTALQIIDDWDETDRAKVNPIAGQAGVQGGAGAVSANTQRVAIATDANTVVLGAGSALAGDVGLQPRTSGGVSNVFLDSDVDNTAAAVKASAGQVYWIHVINLDAAVVYLYLYDIAAASVTVGVSSPKYRIPVPTQAATANGAGMVVEFPHGLEFGTAISVAASQTLNTNDDPGANLVHVAIGYE